MLVVRERLSCHPLFRDVEMLLRCFEVLRGIPRLALSSDCVAIRKKKLERHTSEILVSAMYVQLVSSTCLNFRENFRRGEV